MSKYIYIAGPYTSGDVCANVATAMAAWHALADLGLFPFCPHLSHFLHMQRQRPYFDWMAQDLAWLDLCDALLRLPGVSSGADVEVARAEELGLRVYYSVAEVIEAQAQGVLL